MKPSGDMKVDYMLPVEVKKDHSEIPWGLVLLAVVVLIVGMIFERMVIDPFISTVHASEDVSDLPDKMQEKYFCHQWMNGMKTVGARESEIMKFCKEYN